MVLYNITDSSSCFSLKINRNRKLCCKSIQISIKIITIAIASIFFFFLMIINLIYYDIIWLSLRTFDSLNRDERKHLADRLQSIIPFSRSINRYFHRRNEKPTSLDSVCFTATTSWTLIFRIARATLRNATLFSKVLADIASDRPWVHLSVAQTIMDVVALT